MAVKKRTKREKRYMTKEEVQMRKLLAEHNVTQQEIAQEMNVNEAAVTYHLRSLTPTKVEELKAMILKISERNTPQKVAS